jgi:predicted NUDIX family NTP pyrophosphohydrolase
MAVHSQIDVRKGLILTTDRLEWQPTRHLDLRVCRAQQRLLTPVEKMAKTSAGLLMYRFRHGSLEIFLVHPGGPFWAKKDLGVWSIPKGEFGPGEDPLEAAQREFHEETGYDPEGPFRPLTPVKQGSGKIVHAWAFEGDCDAAHIKSNTFSIEWPPRSGKQQEFPEIDRAGWFSVEAAKERILKGQCSLIDELQRIIAQ